MARQAAVFSLLWPEAQMSSRWFQVSLTQANIYVAANPLLSGSQVSHEVSNSTAVIPTSTAKYRVLGPIDRFACEQRQSTHEVHSVTFGGDATCTACNRVLRLPGFPNSGHDPAWPVTIEYPNDSASIARDFRFDIPAANAMLLPVAIPSREHPDKHTDSEHDLAWVCANLVAENTPQSSRRGPPINPYSVTNSRQTGDVASPRRWLIESVSMGDVVMPLGTRRGEACSLYGIHSFRTGNEGVIDRSFPGWSKNGASHRKNCDTPPLVGNCRET